MITKKIEQFLENTAHVIFRRGKDLFQATHVLSVSFNEEKDEYSVIVEGSSLYTVLIKDSHAPKKKIKTKCSCPYVWDDVCKHTVAALLAIYEDISEADSDGSLSQRDFDYITRQLMEQTPRYVSRQLTVSPGHTDLNALEFHVLDQRNYWHSKNILLRIENENGRWRFQPCCNEARKDQCAHQRAVMSFMNQYYGGYDFLERIQNLEVEKNIARKKYYTGDEIIFDDFFELQFVLSNKQFEFVPKDKSIKSNDDLNKLLSRIVRVKEDSSKTNIPTHLLPDPDRGFAIIFEFYPDDQRNNRFNIDIFTAKYNVARTKLINSFTPYSGMYYAPPGLRQFTEDASLVLLQPGDINLESEYRRITSFFAKNLELLQRNLIYFRTELYSDSVRSFKLMKILPDLIYPVFDLTLKDSYYHLSAFIKWNGELISVDSKLSFKTRYFITKQNEFGIIYDFPSYTLISEFMETPVFKLHKNQRTEMLQVLKEIGKNFDIRLNDLFTTNEVTLGKPSFQVYLSEYESFLSIRPEVIYESGDRFKLLEDYDGLDLDLETESARKLLRDIAEEERFAELLNDYDPIFSYGDFFGAYLKDYDECLKEGWLHKFFSFCTKNQVEVFGWKELKKLKNSLHSASVDLGIRSGLDWFEADVKLRFGDEEVPLEVLHPAIVRRDNYVQLSDGKRGIIPQEWIKKFETLIRAGTFSNGKIKISKLKYNLIDELYGSIDDEEVLREIEEKKNRLNKFSSIETTPLPPIVNAELRQYQKEGFYWLNFLDHFGFGGCLADDMGLGKTLQMITFLAQQKMQDRGTSLVVVPKSLLYNWSAELDKFCPSLKYLHYHGKRNFDADEFAKYDIIITTYNTVMLDIPELKTFLFNYVILDESQAIKNPTSQRYKSACLLNARNRVVMTGTPVENNTFDLYAQFNFLNRGFLGTQKYFKDQYSSEIDIRRNADRAEELRKIVQPFLLRRTKQQVASDLPEKTEQVLKIQMGAAQRQVYQHYLEEIRKDILEKEHSEGQAHVKMRVIQGLTKLRQICNSPLLITKSDFECRESAKIELLMDHILPLVKTNKVLVFSQFTKMLGLIANTLQEEGVEFSYLDGKTKDRIELVDEFNNKEKNRVFLISLKAGGTGLNLTSADYVFLIDPWWNPAAEAQAIDRTHRIGQKNHVFAYKMVCEGTIEEKILELQSKKKQISDQLIQTQEGFVKNLSRKDIEVLFS